MSRTSILFSLGLLAGCSFVDDFDKFQANDQVALPGDDAGQPVPDATAPEDAAGGKPDATTSVPDAAVQDTGVVGGDAAAPVDSGSTGAPDATVDASGPACAPVDCDDGDPCTENRCTAGVCSNPQLDVDKDTFSPSTCKTGPGGGDCDDNNPNIHPGLAEVCDEVDNNCNGLTDEGFSKFTCFPDLDRDGFPNLKATAVLVCKPVCAAPLMAVADSSDQTQHDCYDVADADGASVFPGQTNFFDRGYGAGGKNDRSFDYNCSSAVETQYKPLNGSCGGLLSLLCDGSAGFVNTIPGCGETGDYQTCGSNGLNCEGNTESRKQQCH